MDSEMPVVEAWKAEERARIIGLIRKRAEEAGRTRRVKDTEGLFNVAAYHRGRLDALSALLSELEGEQ